MLSLLKTRIEGLGTALSFNRDVSQASIVGVQPMLGPCNMGMGHSEDHSPLQSQLHHQRPLCG